MKHEITQWKCFVPDTPSDLWPYMVLCGALQFDFSHKMMLVHLKVPYYSTLTLSGSGYSLSQTKYLKLTLNRLALYHIM